MLPGCYYYYYHSTEQRAHQAHPVLEGKVRLDCTSALKNVLKEQRIDGGM